LGGTGLWFEKEPREARFKDLIPIKPFRTLITSSLVGLQEGTVIVWFEKKFPQDEGARVRNLITTGLPLFSVEEGILLRVFAPRHFLEVQMAIN